MLQIQWKRNTQRGLFVGLFGEIVTVAASAATGHDARSTCDPDNIPMTHIIHCQPGVVALRFDRRPHVSCQSKWVCCHLHSRTSMSTNNFSLKDYMHVQTLQQTSNIIRLSSFGGLRCSTILNFKMVERNKLWCI